MKRLYNPNFGHDDYEIVERKVLHEGMFRLVRLSVRYRLFNGNWSNTFHREILERSSAAAVLPYDPILDRVILIEQFRPGATADPKGPWQIEIPAGIIDREETPADVAIREANEEAGCTVSHLELLQDYFVSSGGANEYIHIFAGKADSKNVQGIHGLEQENENIRVLNISTDEALALLYNRELKNAPIIISLQWLELHRERLRKEWK